MKHWFKRPYPDGLAGRIVLLLATTILAANIIALVVLNIQKERFDRQTSENREVERIATLVPAMETVDGRARRIIARDASTRFARVRVSDSPLLTQSATDSRSRSIVQDLADAMGRDDVRVAIIDRPVGDGRFDEHNETRAGRVIAITVPLSARDGQPDWLNVVTSGAPPRKGATIDSKPFLTVLGLSLVCMLVVAVLLAAQMAKPLEYLSAAAEAAGRGDRTARVPEEGAREVRRAARAFNAMQSEISQFDVERMRMVAAVGHDLRTPMTSLRIRAEMVEDDEQREAITRTLDEMAILADGLISYARDGREAEPLKPVDLHGLLTQVCEDRGADYIGGMSVQVRARRVGLGRAFGNLIDNAKRYGGSAVVMLESEPKMAVVTINDNGPGIPPEQLDEMFLPFTRGDDSRNIDTGGVGLGLSIARSIIASHKGELTLMNRPEGGLSARVCLPIEVRN